MAIEDEPGPAGPARRPAPPVFNVPAVVVATIAVFALIHAVRVYVLGDAADEHLLVDFSFISGCYGQDCGNFLRRDAGALLWSPLSYAFLHGDWTHLGLNTVWLLAFGTPVARRLGAMRFLGFGAVGALAGAGVFYAFNPDLVEPVIGASGIVSALMGGACRFAFAAIGRAPEKSGRWTPLLSVWEALRNRTILFFILIFFFSNFLTGAGLSAFLDGGAKVAWEAHVGGFAFGFLCFALFDRRPGEPASA